jgi:hypothetical protein
VRHGVAPDRRINRIADKGIITVRPFSTSITQCLMGGSIFERCVHSSHADEGAGFLKARHILGAGVVLYSPVRMMDQSRIRPPAGQRHLQSGKRKARVDLL